MNLSYYLIHSAEKYPHSTAVSDSDYELSYKQLDELSNQVAKALSKLGVRKGERVAIWLHKSVRAIAVMQGTLRVGAAYVPLDPNIPGERARTIMEDCEIKALVVDSNRISKLQDKDYENYSLLTIDRHTSNSMSWEEVLKFYSSRFESLNTKGDELAYVLYTSGSTGKPKGVSISHRNAISFINWATTELQINSDDVLSNHAPFHFDLSVLDLYGAFSSGAKVCIIPQRASYDPKSLVNYLVTKKITIWYSVPSALTRMIVYGGLLKSNPTNLRIVIFAGEYFPIKYVRQLREKWQSLRMYNFYGPTETNVCTYYEVTNDEVYSLSEVPIGKSCSGNNVWAVKDDGIKVVEGEEGELVVSGSTVMLGYWGQESQYNKPFYTGDIVKLERGEFYLRGRRDSLVKVRGYRVEPSEIESILLRHDKIVEAAVLISGYGADAKIIAFIKTLNNNTNLIDIKQHCSKFLPTYMIVEKIKIVDFIPRTVTGKIDRKGLARSFNKTVNERS